MPVNDGIVKNKQVIDGDDVRWEVGVPCFDVLGTV